jgi:hypothetical protein
MTKTLVFDMDGTITNLYGVNNWLEMIRAENPKPYIIAEPLYNMNELNSLLNQLKSLGWEIVITSWLAKGATDNYNKAVTKAKKEWLQKYHFPADEVHIVKYGATKANSTRKKGGYQILIDDNAKIRKGWHLGNTINAENDIIAELRKLLD